MKKVISILAACMLVFSFAGMVSAQDIPGAGECESAGNIFRGCERPGEQTDCSTTPFDYEDFGDCSVGMGSYCAAAGKDDYHRALIPICDCIQNLEDFDEPNAGDVYDVFMEILVDKGDGEKVGGDNGVYFAEDVGESGVLVQAFEDDIEACDEIACDPADAFQGSFVYLDADGDTVTPYMGNNCEVDEDARATSLEPANVEDRPTFNYDPDNPTTAPYGYTVTAADVSNGRSTWWVDIPMLRADSNITERGWKVYVKVSIQLAEETGTGGLCSDCPKCEHLVEIGTLCCDEAEESCADTLIFPYFPDITDFWFGLVITNLGSEDGLATINLYETGTNGDKASGTVTVPANGTRVFTSSELYEELSFDESPDGVLGNASSYLKIVTDFPASGFAMQAKRDDGTASMGYLPVRPDCSSCDLCQ